MPEAFPGECIQTERAVGKEIVTFTATAEKIGKEPGADENQTAGLIKGSSTPIVSRARGLPFVTGPGFVSEFSRTGDGVKAPDLFAGAHIKRSRITGSGTTAFGKKNL